MDVSSSTNAPAQTGKDPMKKAMEVQEQQVLKVLDGLDKMTQQTQEMNAQKTGVGKNINMLG